jgi:eukaryotic-like serine/threonine-protein kinase
MRDDVLGTIRDALGTAFDILGEMGREGDKAVAFLARDNNTGRLVALKVANDGVQRPGSELALSIRRALDSTVPAQAETCVSCGAAMKSWARFCAICNRDQAGRGNGDVVAREAVAAGQIPDDEYELLGEMPRAEGGRPVYFGRRHDTGTIVALHINRAGNGNLPDDSSDEQSVAAPAEANGSMTNSYGSESEDFEPETEVYEGGTGEYDARTEEFDVTEKVEQLPESAAAASPLSDTSATSVNFCPTCGTEYEAGVWFCPRDGCSVKPRFGGPDLVGQVIAGRYRVIRKIAEGGMGQVYYAEHVRIGRPCALKIMNPALKSDPESLSRFGREAAHASRIDHPHVATVHDFGETDDGMIFLAMDYADGEPLTDMLAREHSFAPDRAVEIARQIADALAAAHEKGIVHRDLKPDNVIIAQRAGRDFARVIDFGIAKALEGGSTRLTRAGFVVGTPRYMSPEQLVADPVDPRSDIYSLGCILFEMLVGMPVFGTTTGEVRITKRLTEPAPSARSHNSRVSQDIDRIVVRALGRSPEERFQSANELHDALARALVTSLGSPEPAHAGRASAPPRGARTPVTPGARLAPLQSSGTTPPAAARAVYRTNRDEFDSARPTSARSSAKVLVLVAEVAALVALVTYGSLASRASVPEPLLPTTAKASLDAPAETASVPEANGLEREPAVDRSSDPPRTEPRAASARTPERDAERAAPRPNRTPPPPPVTPAPTISLPEVRAAFIRAESARRAVAPPAAPAASPSATAVDSIRGLLAEALRQRNLGNYASAFGTFRTAQTRLDAMRVAFPLSYTTAALNRELGDQLRATVSACQAYREVRISMSLQPPDCSPERR